MHRRVTPSSVMFQQGNATRGSHARVGAVHPWRDSRRMRRRAHDWSSRIGHDVGADHPRRRTGARGKHPAAHYRRGVTIVVAVRRCHAGNAKQIVGSLLTALHAAAAAEPARRVEPVAAAVEPSAVEAAGAAVERFASSLARSSQRRRARGHRRRWRSRLDQGQISSATTLTQSRWSSHRSDSTRAWNRRRRCRDHWRAHGSLVQTSFARDKRRRFDDAERYARAGRG